MGKRVLRGVLFFLCFVFVFGFVSAEHNISGKVLDAFNNEAADGKIIFLWNTENGQEDNLSDTIGAGGNSGAANNYTIDCEQLSTPCGEGDNLSVQVIDGGETFSEVYTLLVSAGAADYLSEFRLDSRPEISVVSPTGSLSFESEVFFNCSYNDSDSETINVSLYSNKSGSFEVLYSELGVSGFLAHTESFPKGNYSFYCVADDGLLSNTTSQYDFSVNGSSVEIKNISIEDFAEEIILNANDTRRVSCVSRIYHSNSEDNISGVEGRFYDIANSYYSESDDKNEHYTNSSCEINKSFISWQGHADDAYHVLANCTFEVEYYSNPGEWNCEINVTGQGGESDQQFENVSVLELLAFSVPDFVDYGVVDAKSVSGEKIISIENFGNVAIDLQVSGFAENLGDGLAMVCSSGVDDEINLSSHRYNFTTSNPGELDFAGFVEKYGALASSPLLEQLDLNYRQNDFFSEADVSTYWRVYVPKGVAGTCEGNVVLSAIKS